jgi:hypothetical protein
LTWGFTTEDFVAGARRFRAAGMTLSAADTKNFDRRLDGARSRLELESVLRAKRRAGIFTDLVNSLKESSSELQVAIELHQAHRRARQLMEARRR